MLEFEVQAMSCNHCVDVVTRAVREVDPQAQVQVDLDAKRVRVETAQSRERVAAALTDSGYAPH